MKTKLFILALLLTFAPAVLAHEVRPAYLELRQTGPETYDALWKVPGQGDLHLGLYVELPAACTNVTEPRGSTVDNAYTERWTVKCPGGLSGGTIHIAGLSVTVVDVLVRFGTSRWQHTDHSAYTHHRPPSSLKPRRAVSKSWRRT